MNIFNGPPSCWWGIVPGLTCLRPATGSPACLSVCDVVPRSLLRSTAGDAGPAACCGAWVWGCRTSSLLRSMGVGMQLLHLLPPQLHFLELLSEPAEGDQAEKWFCLPAWPCEPPEVSENRATRMENKSHQSGGALLSPPWRSETCWPAAGPPPSESINEYSRDSLNISLRG